MFVSIFPQCHFQLLKLHRYRDREVDIPIKMVYHMSMNLFDWLNSVGVLNVCSSYGYRQADGKFDGVVREMADGRSEFAGLYVHGSNLGR